MEHDFWHRRWNKNEIGFHQQQINLHLQELWHSFEIEPGTPVFVPLCGKSQDMLWLAEQGHPVLGIELSELAVESFFSEASLSPTVTESPPFRRYSHGNIEILVGDFFSLEPAHLDTFEVVYDRASLIAFPPEMRPRYSRHLNGLLPSGAKIMLITLEYSQEEMKGPPFCVKESEVNELMGDTMRIEKLRELDVLSENPRFIRRGLTALQEKVFRLRKR